MLKGLLGLFLLFTTPVVQTDMMHLKVKDEKIDTLNRSDFSLLPYHQPIMDQQKVEEYADQLEELVYKEPVDATIDKHNQLVGEQSGQELARKKFIESFYTNYYNNSQSFTIPLKTVYPKVDSELLNRIRMKKIGQYITYFNNRNKQRSHNIVLAAQSINNHVVFPGETFSFNHVVGKRTIEKGYLPAPVIVRGELTEGIGGGICQVSSTLFNAVDRAGVKIIERYSHSRRVPYVPPKRDATVSWYGPDFTFKNPHNQPILIRSNIYGGQLLISIYSSEGIDYKRRDVPSAPTELPNEVNIYERD